MYKNFFEVCFPKREIWCMLANISPNMPSSKLRSCISCHNLIISFSQISLNGIFFRPSSPSIIKIIVFNQILFFPFLSRPWSFYWELSVSLLQRRKMEIMIEANFTKLLFNWTPLTSIYSSTQQPLSVHTYTCTHTYTHTHTHTHTTNLLLSACR